MRCFFYTELTLQDKLGDILIVLTFIDMAISIMFLFFSFFFQILMFLCFVFLYYYKKKKLHFILFLARQGTCLIGVRIANKIHCNSNVLKYSARLLHPALSTFQHHVFESVGGSGDTGAPHLDAQMPLSLLITASKWLNGSYQSYLQSQPLMANVRCSNQMAPSVYREESALFQLDCVCL